MERLIYTDSALNDIGYASGFVLDLEDGKDNDFTFKIALADFKKYKTKTYIYVEGAPEFGGMISSFTSNTADASVVFAGKTWRGMFQRRYLCENLTYEAGATIGSVVSGLIRSIGLEGAFEAVQNEQTLEEGYSLNAFGNALDELETMLKNNGCRPSFRFDPTTKRIKIGAEAIKDLSNDEYDSSQVDLEIYVNTMPVNHVVAVLDNSTALHRYLLLDGTQSDSVKEITGTEEVMTIIRATAESDASEAMKAVIEESIAASQTCAVAVKSLEADIGDIVGGTESQTGVSVKAVITSKILKMTEFTSVVNLETGV